MIDICMYYVFPMLIIKSGKKQSLQIGCYSPWKIVANKLGVVTHHAR